MKFILKFFRRLCKCCIVCGRQTEDTLDGIETCDKCFEAWVNGLPESLEKSVLVDFLTLTKEFKNAR